MFLFLSRNSRNSIAALISPHKSNKYLSLRDIFFSHRLHRFYRSFAIFSPSVQRPLVPDLIILHYAQDFVLLRYKTLLITKFALRMTQIFYRCAIFSQLFSFSLKLHKFYKSFRYYFFCDYLWNLWAKLRFYLSWIIFDWLLNGRTSRASLLFMDLFGFNISLSLH